MSLPGCASIPAPYRERPQMVYRTGRRIVEMAYDDLLPSRILTKEAFLNATAVTAAIGGSTNAHPHLMAIARHSGFDLTPADWNTYGYPIPLLDNVQPSGEYLCENFHRAGGLPAIMSELMAAGVLNTDCLTVSGRSIAENLEGKGTTDRDVIKKFQSPLKDNAGMLVLTGNFFDFAIMKTCVISEEFEKRYLSSLDKPGVFEARAIVFEGSKDYHGRINDPSLEIDENCILVVRGAGPVGWPGAAEVVNMQPPDALIKRGVTSLPTLEDGRQSGTSDSPTILHVSPEGAVGGGIAKLQTGDIIRVDITNRRCDVMIDPEKWTLRKISALAPPASQTPWQMIYRESAGSLASGFVIEGALGFKGVSKNLPRHNH